MGPTNTVKHLRQGFGALMVATITRSFLNFLECACRDVILRIFARGAELGLVKFLQLLLERLLVLEAQRDAE